MDPRTYGRHTSPDEIECFWHNNGFTIDRLASCWRSRTATISSASSISSSRQDASRFVAGHEGLEIDYNLLLIHKTLPD